MMMMIIIIIVVFTSGRCNASEQIKNKCTTMKGGLTVTS